MFESLITLDKKLFLILNQLGTHSTDWIWIGLSTAKYAIPLYGVVLFFLYKRLGRKQFAISLLFVAVIALCADQLSNFFKYGTQRLRPCHEADLVDHLRLLKAYCGGKYSFFSAHAANNFALFSFLYSILKAQYKWAWLLLLWASLVAYSRIMMGVHYPIDVLFGSAVGLFVGWVFYKLFQKKYL